MQRIFLLLKGNVVLASISLIILLIVLTVFFAIRNQAIMRSTNEQIRDADKIIKNVQDLWVGINLMDLGVRGYALTHKDGLLNPFHQATQANPTYLDTIRYFMDRQQLSTKALEEYVVLNDGYIQVCRQLIGYVDTGDMDAFTALLEEDRGLALWQSYSAFSTDLINLQTSIKKNAEVRYQSAVRGNMILQIVLLLIGVPSLYFIFYRIRRQDSSIARLQQELDENNRKYVFDPGTNGAKDLKATMDASIQNLKHASEFIEKITKGASDVSWPGLTQQNESLNRDNLSGTLLRMRDQMKKIKEEDRNRIWVTEGLTQFTEIIRQHQDDVNGLCDRAIRFIARYMEAQQGSVFLIQEEGDDRFLELTACYAFDKKKYVEKRIDLGQGLIGQAFLERSTVTLNEVPNGYTHITSGLGEATPRHILIVPMLYNEAIEGIVEIAGFREWREHERSFIGKATEYMASSLSSVRSTQRMKTLLEQMREQTEQLHSQEEEMRQNMEELAATNEEMKRKEAEYLRQIGAD